MVYKLGWCSICSNKKEDLRVLKKENFEIICLACGARHLLVPEEPQSASYYLRLVHDGRKGRPDIYDDVRSA